MTVTTNKTAFEMVCNLFSVWFRINKEREDNPSELKKFAGYVTIPGLNNGEKIFLNKGFFTKDINP
jgi:hypothetical protein